ncbi:MAG: ABC transporter permease, partial [Rhodothermaceae bacterium]|nr:ABC transporter permease [Rhodothermaceae bacterium]
MRRRFALLTVAFQAIVQHPLRSLLSTLGLVIGVAALVAILSLIDGMEQFAREQIESSTDLQSITATPRTTDQIDGVTIRRDSFPTPTLLDARALDAELGGTATVTLTQRRGVEVGRDTMQSAAALMAAEATIWANAPVELKAGRFFSAAEEAEERRVVVVSASLAERFADSAEAAVGRILLIDGDEAEVVGVVDSEAAGPASVAGPYAAFAEPPEERAPTLMIHVNQAEMVPIVAEQVRGWLDGRFGGGQNGFAVNLYEDYAVQLRQGILLFKLIMGFITGISV